MIMPFYRASESKNKFNILLQKYIFLEISYISQRSLDLITLIVLFLIYLMRYDLRRRLLNQ